MRVRALPRSFDTDWLRLTGENKFCDRWDPGWSRDPCGPAEVEIAIGKSVQRLCRECATDLATQIRECVEMVDGADLFRKAP